MFYKASFGSGLGPPAYRLLRTVLTSAKTLTGSQLNLPYGSINRNNNKGELKAKALSTEDSVRVMVGESTFWWRKAAQMCGGKDLCNRWILGPEYVYSDVNISRLRVTHCTGRLSDSAVPTDGEMLGC